MTNQPNNINPLKHPHQRVGVFIDVQNLYYSAKHIHNRKVNFGSIVREMVAGRRLIRAIAYVVRTESKDEQPFFEALYNQGIETREKELQIFTGGQKKADWDVGLTVDAMRLANSLDAVLLVSGDGDYIPLVEYLQAQGKQVEVAAFSETTSSKLRELVDDFIDLSEHKETFLIHDSKKHLAMRRAEKVAKAKTLPKRKPAPRKNMQAKEVKAMPLEKPVKRAPRKRTTR